MQKSRAVDSLARFSIERLTSPCSSQTRQHPTESPLSNHGREQSSAQNSQNRRCSAKENDTLDSLQQTKTGEMVPNVIRNRPHSVELYGADSDEESSPWQISINQRESRKRKNSLNHSFASYDSDTDTSKACRLDSNSSCPVDTTDVDTSLGGDQDATSSPDPSEKPSHSYIALISIAILTCPEKKLVLSDIYQYIMDNFPYYNNQERAWRNSIRHNLSLNECFIKAGRAENGKGNYWAIHPACVDDFSKGDYRRRHARRRARGTSYTDINVSTLPFNYRCNIGYVPMTPSPVLGYPYPIPYLHTFHHASPLLRGVEMSAMASVASLFAQQNANIDSMFSNVSKDVKRPASDTKNSAVLALTPSPNSAAPTKPLQLLSPPPLPSMLSPPLQYSPYGFPYM